MKYWIPLALFLASCSIYQSQFDCPAGKGVGCKSSTEVMEMVVERRSDEDLFVRDSEAAEKMRAYEEMRR